MIPSHLNSPCCETSVLLAGGCRGCSESVKEGPNGNFFITIGHPGFNSPTNNAGGYVSRQSALKALIAYGDNRRYRGR